MRFKSQMKIFTWLQIPELFWCWRGSSRNEKHLSCLYCSAVVQTREIFISKASASRTKRRESMEAARLETFQSRLWSFAEWWAREKRCISASRSGVDRFTSFSPDPTNALRLHGTHLVHVHALFVGYKQTTPSTFSALHAKKRGGKPLDHAVYSVQQVNRREKEFGTGSLSGGRSEHTTGVPKRHFIHFK